MQIKIQNKFPYGLKTFNEKAIKKLGLSILHSIPSSEIRYDSPALDALFDHVKEKCGNFHVWILFGSDDEENWIPLQAASRTSGNVIDEIRTDFKRMIPYDEAHDKKSWNSYYYKDVMDIKYGFDKD